MFKTKFINAVNLWFAMMMTVSAQDMRLFSLVLLFLINFGTPVNALDKAKEREPTKELNEKRFDQDYQSIVRFYDDDTVGSALSKAQSDLPKMIKGANFFIGEHASRNARKFLDAIDDILDTKWSKAENDLAEARVLEPGPYAGAPNLPDTLFLSVVVNQALGQKTKALGDLTELYELHKEAPALWTDECRFFMIKRSIPDGYYQAAPAAPIERIRQSQTK